MDNQLDLIEEKADKLILEARKIVLEDCNKDKACRSSAQDIIKEKIRTLRRKADGLESLLKLIENSSTDANLAEEALYDLLHNEF